MADEKKNEDRSVDVGQDVTDSIVTPGDENKIFQIQEAHFHGSDVGANAATDRPTGPTTKPISLPFPSIGDLFKGRGEMLQQLRDSLTRKTDGRATAIVGKALYGLGGIGKTRLAVEFAWQHKDDYSAVLLVTADSPNATYFVF